MRIGYSNLHYARVKRKGLTGRKVTTMDFDALIYDLGLSEGEIMQMIDIWEGSVNND